MSTLEMLLDDGGESELILQQHLRSLKEALKQQLQETERRQTEELERRIHLNSLLSADVDGQSTHKNEQTHQAKHVGPRSFVSTHPLTSDKATSNHPRRLERPSSSAAALVSSSDCKHGSARTSRCERVASYKATQLRREEEAEAECQRKFSALPVPSHVALPLYQEMTELREKERKRGLEQRKNFLLSVQKPFSFQEREKEKREKLIAALKQVSQDKEGETATVRKSQHKGRKKADQEVSGEVHGPSRTHDNRAASASPGIRAADRTRKEKLGFLDEKTSFQPKIISQVPDFSRLHKALQTEALRRTQSKDVTRCQPFCLRTSALPARQRLSPENCQVPNKSNLSRSKSLGAMTSLSADTLPTYITDAARKRCMAIRKSMEMRDSKDHESAEWLRKHQMRSQAMRKTVSLRAKLLDPHSSLRDVHDEKLQRHREADQQRMREYTRELRDMKARVNQRPYLFEQVKQRSARARAEQTYRNKLNSAGVKVRFVEENGGAAGGASSSSTSEDAADVNAHGTKNDIRSSFAEEENASDEEKIEDVEEKSVKSKREEIS